MPYERACQPTKCTCIESNTYINKDDDDDEDQSDSDSDDDDDDDDDDNELHYITKKNDKEITNERKPVWEDEADDEERY